jgi:hypothetical protein
MGISSLMSFQDGGSADTSSQNNSQQGLNTLILQAVNPFAVDVNKKAKEYQQVLQSTVRPPTRPSFFDLASDLGAALLAQPTKEKFPSIGRSIGIGFQNFKQELDAKNKAIDEQLDKIALQSVSMALGDKQKAEQNYNDLLYKRMLNAIDPDRGTAVTYGKKMDDGTMSYQTFGNKELDKIAEATNDGYVKIEKPMVQIGGGSTGLDEYYKGLGRAATKREEVFGQDYELAQKSNQLLDQMESYGQELPEEAFGLAPTVFEPINRFIISFPGIRDLPIADGLADIQSKREPMASVTVNLAMMNVQKTKGPISDTEMRLFISSIPSIAQTKQGYFNTIKIMREINDFIINFETARLKERDKYLSKEGGTVSGLQAHMSDWERKWRQDNRVFSKEQLDMFRDKALENEKAGNEERKRIANEALRYFDTVSTVTTTPQKTDINDLTDDEIQELLNQLNT